MQTEAIILSGGLGTRLRDAVPDLPKCLAPVAGRPFLSYVIDYLQAQGIEKFIFSLGYMHQLIEQYLTENYTALNYTTVIETEPLGTGGAIQLAMQKAKAEKVFVTNGDTLFKIQLRQMMAVHQSSNAECTVALKPMKAFDRYGCVTINEQNQITSFKEKQFYAEGLINGGSYFINKKKFLQHSFPQKFSFEKDYLEKFAADEKFYASVQDEYFIDIGIPQDFEQAQKDLQHKPVDLTKIDKSWTLFLDRDGVLNNEIKGEYLLNWKEFIFSNGVLEVFKKLNHVFGRIIIITNQRGVTKELMTEEDLLSIHSKMQREVETAGGRIDAIYYCTHLDEKCFQRKPNPGMALLAAKDFPEIDFSKSVMVGNKPSDARFGRAAGMQTVFVTTTNPGQTFPHPDIDFMFPSLPAFAQAL